MSTDHESGWRFRNFRLLMLPLVALIAISPLLRSGCSCGHDFDFHILSWMEAATQFSHGNLHPHWAFTPGYNAGEPRFVFYPPLSWTLGGALGLVLPWTLVPIVYTWVALTAAGLGCYRLLREFIPEGTALLVAALYAVNPYMLFTAYERTAYAELLAAAWLPLLLHGVLRRRVTVHGIALPVALLWLTNAPAAVIGCYGLAFLATVRLVQTGRSRSAYGEEGLSSSSAELAGRTVAGTVVGIGLAGFYIVPAAYERRYVQIQMALTDGLRVVDNFLFHRTPDADHDAVLRTASMLAVGLVCVTFVALLVAFVRSRSSRAMIGASAGLTMVIALLLTPLSAGAWRYAPELGFLQFPWRFLALLMPVLALGLGLGLAGVRLRARTLVPASLVLAAACTFFGHRSFHQECDPEDTVVARLALFHSAAGTEPTDEYTPVTADNDALSVHDPPFWLGDDADAAVPLHTAAGALRLPLDISSATPQALVMNRRDYPAWRILLNHQVISKRLLRADGLMAIPIPAGASHVELVYARMADQTAGEATSGVALLGLLVTLRRHRRAR